MTDIKEYRPDDSVIGTKYGKRTAIKWIERNKRGDRYLFRCDCGEEKVLEITRLRNGEQLSCFPCLRAETKRAERQRKKDWRDLMKSLGVKKEL